VCQVVFEAFLDCTPFVAVEPRPVVGDRDGDAPFVGFDADPHLGRLAVVVCDGVRNRVGVGRLQYRRDGHVRGHVLEVTHCVRVVTLEFPATLHQERRERGRRHGVSALLENIKHLAGFLGGRLDTDLADQREVTAGGVVGQQLRVADDEVCLRPDVVPEEAVQHAVSLLVADVVAHVVQRVDAPDDPVPAVRYLGVGDIIQAVGVVSNRHAVGRPAPLERVELLDRVGRLPAEGLPPVEPECPCTGVVDVDDETVTVDDDGPLL